MDYLIFKVSQSGGTWYRMWHRNHQDMFLLSMFLTDDVGPGSGPDNWIEWIKDPIDESTGSNFCSLEKEGDFIILGCDLYAPEENCGPIPFKIPKAQLVYILEQWKQVRLYRPSEVIIRRQNNVYEIIQNNNDMPQA